MQNAPPEGLRQDRRAELKALEGLARRDLGANCPACGQHNLASRFPAILKPMKRKNANEVAAGTLGRISATHHSQPRALMQPAKW
jgi:hypothetical protein